MDDLVGRLICNQPYSIDSFPRGCRQDTAAYRAHRHYYAEISVYKIDGGKKLIGNSFDGYYVPAYCFEDVPEYYIDRAIKTQKVIDSTAIKGERGTNMREFFMKNQYLFGGGINDKPITLTIKN